MEKDPAGPNMFLGMSLTALTKQVMKLEAQVSLLRSQVNETDREKAERYRVKINRFLDTCPLLSYQSRYFMAGVRSFISDYGRISTSQAALVDRIIREHTD